MSGRGDGREPAARIPRSGLLPGREDGARSRRGGVRHDRACRGARLSVEEAAWGIYDLVSENMAGAARVHIVEKGRDPRRYAMVAMGGAGRCTPPGSRASSGCARWSCRPRRVRPRRSGSWSPRRLRACPILADASRESGLRRRRDPPPGARDRRQDAPGRGRCGRRRGAGAWRGDAAGGRCGLRTRERRRSHRAETGGHAAARPDAPDHGTATASRSRPGTWPR